MTFMVQILKKTDGTFSKGTSEQASEKDALIAMHTAMASAMSKADTESIMCMLTDEFGSAKKREFWSAPVIAETAESELSE